MDEVMETDREPENILTFSGEPWSHVSLLPEPLPHCLTICPDPNLPEVCLEIPPFREGEAPRERHFDLTMPRPAMVALWRALSDAIEKGAGDATETDGAGSYRFEVKTG